MSRSLDIGYRVRGPGAVCRIDKEDGVMDNDDNHRASHVLVSFSVMEDRFYTPRSS